MRKLTLVLTCLLALCITLSATEAPAVVNAWTEQTTPQDPPQAATSQVGQDDSSQSVAEDARKKKRRKKKKKKNPVLKYVLGGAFVAAVAVFYVLTDGEGYHSR